jgi:hypothetical protein
MTETGQGKHEKQTEQEGQHPEPDSQGRTLRIRVPECDCQTGQPGQDGRKRTAMTARTGYSESDSQTETARMEKLERDNQNGTASIEQQE